MRKPVLLLIVLILAVVIALFLGCKKEELEKPPTGPTGGGGGGAAGLNLNLIASRVNLLVNGDTTTIIASVDTNGVPLAHKVITLSKTHPRSQLNPTTPTTDSLGIARAILTSPPDTALGSIDSIVAAADGVTKSVLITYTNVTISQMTAEPESLAADGVGLSKITAILTDVAGAPLHGETVQFSSLLALGTFTPTSDTTDALGRAVSYYKAGVMVGVDTLKAYYSAQVNRTVPMRLYPLPNDTIVGSIVIHSVSNEFIYVHGSGGMDETSELVYRVNNRSGSPMPRPVPVILLLVSGPDGGEYIYPNADTSDASGFVMTNLTSGDSSGTVKVVAWARNALGDSIGSTPVPITILGGPPEQNHFSLAAERLNIAGRVFYGLTDLVTAYVRDVHGNPVPPNTAVWFWSDAGSMIPGQGVTDSSGIVKNTLMSSAPDPATGFAKVHAETRDWQGNPIDANMDVLFSGPAMVAITPDTFSLAYSESKRFDILVSDDLFNPLTESTKVVVKAYPADTTIASLYGDTLVYIPDTQSPGWTMFYVILRAKSPGYTGPCMINAEASGLNGYAKMQIFGDMHP
jgi:hypothetical protein